MRAGRSRWIPLMVVFLILVIGTTVIAAPYGSRSLYTGRIGADVVELQRRLNTLGYSVGAADGIFGPRTRAALMQFQQQSGLATDGVAEQWDFQALNRATAYRRATAYTVKSGDTLNAIAQAHGTTAEILIWLNQLLSDQIRVGQVIRIPVPEEQLSVPPARAPDPPVQQPGGEEPLPPPSDPVPAPPTSPDDQEPPPAEPPGDPQPPAEEPADPAPAPPAEEPASPPPPVAEDPAGEPAPVDPQPMPGHRWVLPGLIPLDYLIIDPPPPPQAPAETPPPQGDRPLVVGYYAEDWQGDTRALSSLRQAGENVDMVVNFQLQIDRNGNLATRPYPELLKEASARGIQVYGLVHNYHGASFDKEVARAVLGNPEVRRHAVEQMLTAARSFGLAGIDIDIENVPPDQRDNYTALIRELSERLKPEGYGVTISIPAKTFDDRRSSWSGAFDYAALGQYADKVAIMTYDEHTPGFAAGPVASVGWVEKVVAFAASQMDPKKVLLGIAAYGYDWVQGTSRARGLSAPQAEALAARHGATIQWDAKAQVPFFTYTENGTHRIVYFESAESTGPKLDLVAKYGLGGIAIWRMGLEDPGIWSVIEQKLR
ncbi:MAG: glycosyl hydrolase family 18 protein [Bacillota bacterium]